MFRDKRQVARTKCQGARRGNERNEAWYDAWLGIRQGMVRQDYYNLDKARDKRQVGRGKGEDQGLSL